MSRRRVVEALKTGQAGQIVDVRGWVRTRRDSKQAFSFVELNDGSCLANLQIVIDANVPGYADAIKHVTTGASIVIGNRNRKPAGSYCTKPLVSFMNAVSRLTSSSRNSVSLKPCSSSSVGSSL